MDLKILHTSDWHLGRTLWNHSRVADHEAVLAEMIAIAAEHRPDVIIHSGDVFDQARPSVLAKSMATDALQKLAEIAPVVVVCGNHDSAPLLAWLHGLMNYNGRIHLVADPDGLHTGSIVTVPVGDQKIHVAALPFINANRVINVFDNPDGWRGTYAQYLASAARQLIQRAQCGADPARDVIAFATHQYVGGTQPSKSENRGHITDLYATDPDLLPDVNYLAFGHIHKPQRLPGPTVGHYAGSPLQLDFGEDNDDKSLVLARLAPGHETTTTVIPLTTGRRVRRLSGTVEQLRNTTPAVTDEFCHVTVKTDTRTPGIATIVASMFPDATVVHIHEDFADRHLELASVPGGDDGLDLIDLFIEYLAVEGTRHSSATTVRELFQTLLASADDEAPRLAIEELLDTEIVATATPGTSA